MNLWFFSIVAALLVASIADAGILQRLRDRRHSRHGGCASSAQAGNCSGGHCPR